MPSFNMKNPFEGSPFGPEDYETEAETAERLRESEGYISDDDALYEYSSDFK